MKKSRIAKSSQELAQTQAKRQGIKFLVTLLRGVLAITLGVILIVWPDKTRWFLANFMGMFWLVSGLVSLRWGAGGERAGAVGLLAGIGMLGRGLASNFIAEDVVISIVGFIIVLTGLLHMFGGVQQDQLEIRQWSLTGFLLGIFEVVLGLVLVISPLERGPIIYFAGSIWALLGGLILIGEALRLRRLSQLE